MKLPQFDQRQYASFIITNGLFRDFEVLYYTGKDALNPHGIDSTIWRQEWERLGGRCYEVEPGLYAIS